MFNNSKITIRSFCYVVLILSSVFGHPLLMELLEDIVLISCLLPLPRLFVSRTTGRSPFVSTSCQMLETLKMKVQTPGDASSLAQLLPAWKFFPPIAGQDRGKWPSVGAMATWGRGTEADVLSGGKWSMTEAWITWKTKEPEDGARPFHLLAGEHVRWPLAHQLAHLPAAPLPSPSSCSSLASSLLRWTQTSNPPPAMMSDFLQAVERNLLVLLKQIKHQRCSV